jgi:acyl-CoA synthetase (AMP-forming)/AMP-acid ligase II
MSMENSFVEVVRRRARQDPDAVAFTFARTADGPEDILTCRDLDTRARAVAALLQQDGMRGQRAVLLYPPSIDYVSALIGCMYAGVTAVPVYPPRDNGSLDRVISVAATANVCAMLTTTAVLASVGRIAPVLTQSNARWITTDMLADDAADAWSEHLPERGELAVLQFTSGSTGNPKGVMLRHGNLMVNSAQINDAMELGPADRGVIWLPPYHDMGLIGGILQPLYAGFPVHLMSPALFIQKPLRWLQAITAKRATISGGPNFAFDHCVDRVSADKLDTLDLSSWKLAFNGAEPIRANTLRRFAEHFAPCGFRASSFFPCYGLAEATLCVSGLALTAEPTTLHVSVAALENHVIDAARDESDRKVLVGSGRPVAGLDVRIVDPESRQTCSDGEIGEIWVCGESVSAGYWDSPAATEAAFHAALSPSSNTGPYLRTGDLGFFNQGELFVTGRLTDLIIVRGKNHYPQDIENTVTQSHQALQQGSAAAFLLDDDNALGIVVEVRRGFSADIEEVESAIAHAVWSVHGLAIGQLALIRAGSIAKTSSGKVRRFLCRTQMRDGTLLIVKRESVEAV